MYPDSQGRLFRLLTVHCVVSSLATSLAGGFIGAFLLRLGFSLPTTIAMYAMLLAFRLAVRAALIPVIKRIGMRQALVIGRIVMALQFLPLMHADRLFYLALWVLIVSVGECIYWPICHAANAMGGGGGRRGWQIALRQVASTGISVAGPAAGGMILTQAGPDTEFGIAAILGLVSAAPLLWMGRLELGQVPTFRQSLSVADPVGLLAFAGDGFMSAGLGIAWPMILFTSLHSSFGALGLAGSVAALLGALAGLGCGIAIDRGHRGSLARGVSLMLLISIAFRVVGAWSPWAAFAANAVGAAVGGAYYPVLMSMIYDRAKQSGSAYQFHLAAEAGWDAGAILGCLAAALVVWGGAPITMAVIPSVLGVLVVHRNVREGSRGRMGALAA